MFNKKLLSILIIFLLIIWLVVSTGRSVYNISKLFNEEREWFFLTTEQQKIKQFGELHLLFRFIQTKTIEKSYIKFYTNNHQAYFFSRYYLYPTKLSGTFVAEIWNDKSIKYNYILLYPVDDAKLIKDVNNELTKYNVQEKYEFKNNDITKAILYKI